MPQEFERVLCHPSEGCWAVVMCPGATSRELQGCVEMLGGNEVRSESLLLAGLHLILVARPAVGRAGGDLYCLHSCGHRTLVKIALLDITGHGERSALIAKRVHHLLHEHSMETGPTRLLDSLNRQFSRFVPSGTLASSLCAVYDLRRAELHYAYGGQPYILLCKAEHSRWISLAPTEDSVCGLPLGVMDGGCYEEQSAALSPGDTLLFFSDGVSEMPGRAGTRLEFEGVLELAQKCTDEMGSASPLASLAHAFLGRLEDFHGGPFFEDDVTLLWVRRLPEEATAVPPPQPG